MRAWPGGRAALETLCLYLRENSIYDRPVERQGQPWWQAGLGHVVSSRLASVSERKEQGQEGRSAGKSQYPSSVPSINLTANNRL